MLRALLATIFAVLTASAAVAVDRSPAPAEINHFAAKFDPCPAHQGQDQIDIDKQPCFSPQTWSGKAAVETDPSVSDRRHMPAASLLRPPHQRASTHILFLYACAPRAPPSITRI
jgi:hypothetical protein